MKEHEAHQQQQNISSINSGKKSKQEQVVRRSCKVWKSGEHDDFLKVNRDKDRDSASQCVDTFLRHNLRRVSDTPRTTYTTAVPCKCFRTAYTRPHAAQLTPKIMHNLCKVMRSLRSPPTR
jgi:hypothetical protein